MSTANLIAGILNIGCALLVIALAVPLTRRRVKMNALYGARFAKSFESDELWYEINAHSGRRLIFWSAVLIAIGALCFFLPLEENSALFIPAVSAPVIYLIPCVETYRYAQRL